MVVGEALQWLLHDAAAHTEPFAQCHLGKLRPGAQALAHDAVYHRLINVRLGVVGAARLLGGLGSHGRESSARRHTAACAEVPRAAVVRPAAHARRISARSLPAGPSSEMPAGMPSDPM